MIREPWFWREQSYAARLIAAGLTPLAGLYDLAQRTRQRRSAPKYARVPVICVGNATLGGVGKTPFAIAMQELLKDSIPHAHFLTRGYGGREDSVQVDPERHTAADVGDEALLLARRGPVWVSKDRVAGAERAANAGARLIIMDDGFQNPKIAKTVSILLIDAADPAGNGKLFPAGPLREPLERAKRRADIIVYVGATKEIAIHAAEENQSPFAGWLEPVNAPAPQRVTAFCGIGNPQKFFDTLNRAGFDIAHEASFPDHHVFKNEEIIALRRIASDNKSVLVTTEKDHVRLAKSVAAEVLTLPVSMQINAPDLLRTAILSLLDKHRQNDKGRIDE